LIFRIILYAVLFTVFIIIHCIYTYSLCARFFFSIASSSTYIYTLSLHDALPISAGRGGARAAPPVQGGRGRRGPAGAGQGGHRPGRLRPGDLRRGRKPAGAAPEAGRPAEHRIFTFQLKKRHNPTVK